MTIEQPIHGICPVCGHEGRMVEYPYQGKVYTQCEKAADCWDRWLARQAKSKLRQEVA